MMVLDDGFRVPAWQERLRLSAKVPVGCVVHTRKALPAVLPAGFRPDASGDRVTDLAEHERQSRTGPRSRVMPRDGVFVRVASEMITGRRLAGTQGVAAGPEFDVRPG